LIVEDDEDTRVSLAEALVDRGFEVLSATNVTRRSINSEPELELRSFSST
jgi:DNA-binding response OmpR family regulator